MEQFIQNMLIGIRQWVNGKIADVNTAIDGKQDTLTAGNNIEITSGGTISVTGIIEPVASDFDIKDLADSEGLREEWGGKQDALTAGDNIEITSGGTISATDTTYVASDFDVKDLADTTGLREKWSGKQDVLTAGNNIEITSAGTISVTGIINDSVVGNGSTYSSSKITNLISTIAQLNIEVVDELPESGDTHTMYLVPAQESGETNSRDEYLWIVDTGTGVGTWELIGTTKTDISNYYTVTEVNALLDDKQNILTAGDNIEITSAGTISVTGITSATNQALEDMSLVISSHIKELNTKIDGKQDKVNVTVEEVLEVLNGSV